MYKKEYGTQYIFAGTFTIAGKMICHECGKMIDRVTDDWLKSQRSTKDDDWYYVCRHRKCCKNEDGWRAEEKRQRKYDHKVSQIVKEVQKYKLEDGTFPYEFYTALEKLGILAE